MKRLLLLEDDLLTSALYERPLLRAGLEVTSVQTIEDFERALQLASPDLIISDLQLMIGSAEDTIAVLAGLTGKYPVVICSGHYSSGRGLELREACAAAGCMDYLDKYSLDLNPVRLSERLRESYDRFHAVKT